MATSDQEIQRKLEQTRNLLLGTTFDQKFFNDINKINGTIGLLRKNWKFFRRLRLKLEKDEIKNMTALLQELVLETRNLAKDNSIHPEDLARLEDTRTGAIAALDTSINDLSNIIAQCQGEIDTTPQKESFLGKLFGKAKKTFGAVSGYVSNTINPEYQPGRRRAMKFAATAAGVAAVAAVSPGLAKDAFAGGEDIYTAQVVGDFGDGRNYTVQYLDQTGTPFLEVTVEYLGKNPNGKEGKRPSWDWNKWPTDFYNIHMRNMTNFDIHFLKEKSWTEVEPLETPSNRNSNEIIKKLGFNIIRANSKQTIHNKYIYAKANRELLHKQYTIVINKSHIIFQYVLKYKK